jgi:hypothetical protein
VPPDRKDKPDRKDRPVLSEALALRDHKESRVPRGSRGSPVLKARQLLAPLDPQVLKAQLAQKA